MKVSPSTFGFSKAILPIEIPFESSKTWGSSSSFESLKSILSFEMTFIPSETWGSSNYFGSPKTLFPLKITFESDQIARKYQELAPDPRPTIPSRLTCDADGDKKVL